MDELTSLDTASLFSSIAEAPMPMEKQYNPLAEVFHEHSAELPDHHLPEPNSEAMVQALKALQVKICGLESERAIAAEKFKHLDLEEETEREALNTDTIPHFPLSSRNVCASPTSNRHELQKRFTRMDERFIEQSHELKNMKQRLHEAETTHQHGFACSKKLEEQHHQLLQHQKKILHHISKPCHVSGARGSKIESSEVNQDHKKTPAFKKSSKRKKVKHSTYGQFGGSLCSCKPVPGVHYRVNLKDVPFLLTTSTSPSHSVTANYQQVLASMKSHSPLLCGAAATTKKLQRVPKSKQKTELTSLLATLEEEFGQLTFEHQELAQQIAAEPSTLKDSRQQEKKLQILVDQMESKSRQIGIVSRELQSRDVCHRKLVIKDHYKCQEPLSPREASVKFLRNMKAIQTTLQQDDLSWD